MTMHWHGEEVLSVRAGCFAQDSITVSCKDFCWVFVRFVLGLVLLAAGSCFFVCDTTCQVFRVSVTVNHLIYIASAASVQLSRMENCTPAPKLLRCSKSYPRQLHMDCQHPRDQSQPERQKNMFLFFVGACNLACESQKHDP